MIARFDPRQLGVGRGDHWITGGALAISTLAAGKITAAAKTLAVLGNGGGILKALSLALWVLTMLWLPMLLVAEALRPRLRYDVRRWSTVFPVGMYAACSFVVGTVAHASGITDFARVWDGSDWQCGRSSSRRCSAAATNSPAKHRHGSTRSVSTSPLPADPTRRERVLPDIHHRARGAYGDGV